MVRRKNIHIFTSIIMSFSKHSSASKNRDLPPQGQWENSARLGGFSPPISNSTGVQPGIHPPSFGINIQANHRTPVFSEMDASFGHGIAFVNVLIGSSHSICTAAVRLGLIFDLRQRSEVLRGKTWSSHNAPGIDTEPYNILHHRGCINALVNNAISTTYQLVQGFWTINRYEVNWYPGIMLNTLTVVQLIGQEKAHTLNLKLWIQHKWHNVTPVAIFKDWKSSFNNQDPPMNFLEILIVNHTESTACAIENRYILHKFTAFLFKSQAHGSCTSWSGVEAQRKDFSIWSSKTFQIPICQLRLMS